MPDMWHLAGTISGANEHAFGMAGTCIWREHASGGNMHLAGTCIWREHAPSGNMHLAGTCIWHGGNMHLAWREHASGGNMHLAWREHASVHHHAFSSTCDVKPDPGLSPHVLTAAVMQPQMSLCWSYTARLRPSVS